MSHSDAAEATVDRLLGLADRFAILFADACEARATEGPGSLATADAKAAKAELEAALLVVIADAERLRGLLEQAAVEVVRSDTGRAQIVAAERERCAAWLEAEGRHDMAYGIRRGVHRVHCGPNV